MNRGRRGIRGCATPLDWQCSLGEGREAVGWLRCGIQGVYSGNPAAIIDRSCSGVELSMASLSLARVARTWSSGIGVLVSRRMRG